MSEPRLHNRTTSRAHRKGNRPGGAVVPLQSASGSKRAKKAIATKGHECTPRAKIANVIPETPRSRTHSIPI